MKEMKKKILIASFFSALMVMVPFTVVGENEYVNNLEVEQSEGESLQSYTINNEMPGILKFIYRIAEEFIEELLEGLNNLENNAEMTEEEIADFLANKEEISQGLTEALSEEILTSGEETVETTDSEDLTETRSGEASASGENTGNEVNMEAEAVSEELEYVEMEENIYIYLAGDIFGTNVIDEIRARFGWLNGIIAFMNLRQELKQKLKEDMIPNVTWVEIIEEGLYNWFRIDFDVEEFLNNLAAALTGMFGGSPEIEQIITYVVQFIYSLLNQKVGANMKTIYSGVKQRFKNLLKAWFGKDLKISPRRAFRQMMLGVLALGLIFWLYIRYMDEEQIQEYKSQLEEDIENLMNAWTNFFNWWDTEPWLEPVHINGTVVNYELLENLAVYCDKDPDTTVTIDEYGYFEGLDFNTADENRPRGPHKCVTTAEDEVTGESKTVGNSGNKVKDIIRVACFSGGNLTLTIDFNEEDNNPYVQSENNAATQEQQGTVEAATEEQTQYS